MKMGPIGCPETQVLNYHSTQISKLHTFSVCPRTFLSFITKVTDYTADMLTTEEGGGGNAECKYL